VKISVSNISKPHQVKAASKHWNSLSTESNTAYCSIASSNSLQAINLVEYVLNDTHLRNIAYFIQSMDTNWTIGIGWHTAYSFRRPDQTVLWLTPTKTANLFFFPQFLCITLGIYLGQSPTG